MPLIKKMNEKILKNLLLYSGSQRPPSGGLGMTGLQGGLKLSDGKVSF